MGSITTGYAGDERTSQRGGTFHLPVGSDTLVMHTDSADLAGAAKAEYGGEVRTDSPNWQYDVVTGTRSMEVLILPSLFRQALEEYRAAECLRRCDGKMTSMVDGRPLAVPCMCAPEMDRGQSRRCKPTTILPALIDLPVDLFGAWEIRSSGWGTASNIKGTMKALALVGIAAGSVPAVLSMVDRQVRDDDGQVHDVVDLVVTIAMTRQRLEDLASRAAAIGPGYEPAALPEGREARLSLLERWADLQTRSSRLGLRDRLLDEWRSLFAGRDLADLDDTELDRWVKLVADHVGEAEDVIRQERAEAARDREESP